MAGDPARGSMSFAASACRQGSTATHAIYQWGKPPLHEKYFKPALRGEKVAAFAITEPNSGSDAASLRTRATRVDGGFVLNGTKLFTSNGTVADFITVVATTDPTKGLKGLDLFLVDTSSPGFSVGRKLDKFSVRSSDTGELVFENVFVPDDHYLNNGSGSSFLNAYKSLTVDAAALADQNASITTEAALAKIVAAEGCHEVCEMAMTVYGGYGLMNEYPAQRYLRDSYFPMIGGGTGDIMRLIVSRQLGF